MNNLKLLFVRRGHAPLINPEMIRLGLIGILFGVLAQAAQAEEKPVVNLKSTVTGNQEQPKVLYIVPWKANVGPEALYQNFNSKVMNQVFGHVEKQELQREVYFSQQSEAAKKPQK